MSYCISNMIGIRAGGVFSGNIDIENMKARISKVVLSLRDDLNNPDLGDKSGDPSHCMSGELEAHKGSYVVLAGVFNYWGFDKASVFASKLSNEFETEVMLMSWDEEIDLVQCQMFLAGKPLLEIKENPLGQTLRRIC